MKVNGYAWSGGGKGGLTSLVQSLFQASFALTSHRTTVKHGTQRNCSKNRVRIWLVRIIIICRT